MTTTETVGFIVASFGVTMLVAWALIAWATHELKRRSVSDDDSNHHGND